MSPSPTGDSHSSDQETPTRHDVCPSCQHKTDWIYIGKQEWPEKIAEDMGRPAITIMWKCAYCGTTITDTGKRR